MVGMLSAESANDPKADMPRPARDPKQPVGLVQSSRSTNQAEATAASSAICQQRGMIYHSTTSSRPKAEVTVQAKTDDPGM